MSSAGSTRPIARTLAARRPGHVPMTRLLAEMAARGIEGVVPPDLMSWHVGAVGELTVGHELARLPREWLVLHGVPAGPTADVDHIVIGPGGVFVLNTKRHPGRRIRVGSYVVWIDGAPVHGYQRSLGDRAAKVRKLLRPVVGDRDVVQPMLVFVDAGPCTTTGEQTVEAVRAGGLVDRLLATEPVLSAGAVVALHAHLARPSTWGVPRDVLDEADPTERFLRLATAAPAPAVAAAPRRAAIRSRPPTRSCAEVHATDAGRRRPRARALERRLEAVLELTAVPAAAVVVLMALAALASEAFAR